MAEEIPTDVIESPTDVIESPVVEDAGPTEFFKITLSPKEFTDAWTSYTEGAKQPDARITSPAQGMAQAIVKSLVYDDQYKGKMDYEGLRMGTSPILAELGFQPGETLTDEQIISLFAEDDEGGKIVISPGYIEGVKRRALGASAGTAGFFAGMQGGNLAVSGVPPVTPWTAAVRIGVPVITGIGGYVVGSVLGDEATNRLMGDEPLIIPGRGKATYEMGKATPDALGFFITPWMAGTKGINIGGKIAADNARNFYGPIVSATGVTTVPKSARAVEYVENVLGRMGQGAFNNPYKTAIIEGAGVAGSVGGTGVAERNAPDNPWVRFAWEAGGGVSGALAADLALNKVPYLSKKAFGGLYNLYKKVWGQEVSETQRKYGLSDAELKDAGNFIIEQLEKNQENPQALYDLINDAQFDKWLVDEAGNKIQLDPATRAASVTLLALQNQFIDAAPNNFGADAGKKMTDAVDALRRAMLALYADGSKDSLQEAAGIQTSLFEATLDSKVANALEKTQAAFRQVGPDGNTADLEAANNIFKILDSQYDAWRADEQSLWRQIPRDVEVNSFINEDGVTTNTPNFVSTWNRLISDEPKLVTKAILAADELSFLKQFVDETSTELGLSPTDAPAPKLPEQRRLDVALDKIAGSNNADLPKNIVNDMTDEGASVEEIMARLREEASAKRGRFSTPRSREVANALDAQANLLAARSRQAQEFQAETGAEQVGLNAYDLVRIRGRALQMGKRLSANNYADEARWAYEMADSLLADLNGLDVGVSKKYDTARSFSYAGNNVFTRTYAGDILGTKKNGAPRVPVEILANTLMKGDSAFFKAAQLNGIANFQITQSLTNLLQDTTKDLMSVGSAAEFRQAGRDLLEDFQKGIDAQSGVLDMDAMRAWYGRNEAAIKDIPGLNTRITDAMNNAVNLNSAKETLLRTVRSAALNEDGSLSTTGLSDWRNNANNQRLLELFPQVKADLDNVETAKNLLETTKVETKASMAAERAGLGLYELLPDKTSNPTTTISKALSQNQTRPFPIMNKYMRMINSVGEDGFTVIAENSPNKGQTWTQQELKDGLRTTIYETIFNASDGKNFSPSAAYNRLFAKHPNGQISVAEWMKSNDLIGESQLNDTRKFLQKMAEVEAFTMKAKPGQTDEFFKDVGEGVKLVAAMGGSAVGTNLKQLLGFESGVGDLVVAGRGARFGQQLAEKYMAELPASLQSSRVAIILENEELLKLVLKTGRSEREKSLLARQLAEAFEQSYVVQFARRVPGTTTQVITEELTDTDGQVIPSDAYPPVSVESEAATGVTNTAPQVIENLPPKVEPKVPTNPSRFSNPTQVPQPSRTNDTQGSLTGPVDRTRYAALFPNDSTTQLMKSGIGSLGA